MGVRYLKLKVSQRMKKYVNIVIVNYNSTDYLLRCLQRIQEALGEVDAEILVYDNASEDRVDRVEEMFPEVQFSSNRKNLGFSRAVNMALKRCYKPYVILLNPDTLVQKGFFDSTLEYMEANKGVAILGPRILNGDLSVQGSARSFPSPLTGLFGRSTLMTKWFPNNKMSRRNVITCKSDGITPMEVDWVSGACMVVRREALDDVGFLDERFFLYWEDADWCKRMRASGWKVIYYPRASIVHYAGGSCAESHIRATVEFHKSAYRLFAKHAKGAQRFAKPLVMWVLALRLLLVISWNVMRRWSGRTDRHSGPQGREVL